MTGPGEQFPKEVPVEPLYAQKPRGRYFRRLVTGTAIGAVLATGGGLMLWNAKHYKGHSDLPPPTNVSMVGVGDIGLDRTRKAPPEPPPPQRTAEKKKDP